MSKAQPPRYRAGNIPRHRTSRSAGAERLAATPETRTHPDTDALSHLGSELLGVCAHTLTQFRADPGQDALAALRAFAPTARFARQLLADAGNVAMLHTRWQRNADYVDDKGHPKVIAARGAAPSFEALCAECGLGGQRQRLLNLACQFGLCSRESPDRLAYVSDVLLVTGHRTLMLARAVVTVERFLRTCLYNAHSGRKLSESLADRTAEVDLSTGEFTRLSKVTRRHLSSFIESSDRQLLAGAARDDRHARLARPRRRCGVSAFVFRD